MPRRALLATIITGAVGALLGVVLGGVVGRVIALFGDETVQTSVPMIFCATLGFFVGGASTIKGSLERFGAKRAPLGTFVAAVVLVLLVGGVSVTAKSGVLVVLTAFVAIVLASVAAVAIGKPEAAPRHGLNSPRTPSAPQQAKTPMPEKRKKARTDDALSDDDLMAAIDPSPTRPGAADAARRIDTTPAPRPRPRATPPEELEDWVPEDEAETDPPLEASDEPARPRRDRPLGRADVPSVRPGPTARPTARATPPVTKATAPAKKAAATARKVAAPAKKAAAPVKKSGSSTKKSAPAIRKAPASNKTRGAAKKSR
ncbi:MAG: hypothetical protein Q8K63_02180 [Acidimicrobiales bacterium]|nr:hypothetical protein [Acidimicrobiales bacterium]